MKSSMTPGRPPYLQVVTSPEALIADPPRNTSPVPGVSDEEWVLFEHSEEIHAGYYEYWFTRGGPFLPDAELKARGLIPPDWEPTIHIHPWPPTPVGLATGGDV